MSNIEIDRNPKGTKEEIDKIRGKIIKNIIEHKLAGKPVDINSAGEIVIKLIKDHDSKDVEEAMYQVHEWMDKIKKDIKEELEEPKDFKRFKKEFEKQKVYFKPEEPKILLIQKEQPWVVFNADIEFNDPEMEISIYGESTKYINKSNIRLKRGDLNECYDRHRVYDYSHTRIVADNGNAFITTEEGSEFVVDVEYGYDILFPKELLSKKDDN